MIRDPVISAQDLPGRDEKEWLVGRALDLDLERREMRRLFQLAAWDGETRGLMGELAALEERLQGVGDALERITPAAHRLTQLESRLAGASSVATGQPALLRRVLGWLQSPQGVSLQPLSFVAGVLVAALTAGMMTRGAQVATPLAPVSRNVTAAALTALAPPPERLVVHDLQFVNAQVRLDWTNRFILPASGAMRLKLARDTNDTVHLQFDASEHVDLEISHLDPRGGRGGVVSLPVDGIGYASLSQPRSGDMVLIRNRGRVPVVVYVRGPRDQGTQVLPDEGAGGQTF
ncbi:MAG: hypothetical protein H7831_15190 [Magnetococcus sp. WYHC-3]